MTCGPTCLHGVYHYFGEEIALEDVIREVRMLEDDGGTLDVFLANHALRRGYRVTLFTYNLELFDPTWSTLPNSELATRLREQAAAKRRKKLAAATAGYLRFLELGGRLAFEDLRPALIRRFLRRGVPIMTGLSATYLYQEGREMPDTNRTDDIRGSPVGHFVVLTGYEKRIRRVHVADPYQTNPLGQTRYYSVDMHRLIGAILLGSLTYDANLLVIERRHG